MTDGTRSRLLGATICAVPLSQPFRMKSYFRTGFPAKIQCFQERPHIALVRKKMALEEGNWPTSLLLVPPPFSFICFIHSSFYNRGIVNI